MSEATPGTPISPAVDRTRQPGIRIEQIFLDHATLAHRADALAFPPSTRVEATLDVSVEAAMTADGSRAQVRVIVATEPDANALYAFEIGMTALVERMEGEANYPLDQYVQTHGPTLLMPFVREAVANLTGRGRFGPVWLHPVNVLAMPHAGAEAPDEGAQR